jgi:DNA transposition AAA+ family ATPase
MTGDTPYQPHRADGQPDRRYRAFQDEQKQEHEDRVLEALDAEGRIIKAARMLPMTGSLTDEHIAGVRDTALDYIKANDITHARIARDIGISASSISEFLNNKHRGDTQKLAREINGWVAQHARAKDASRPREFIMNNVVRDIFSIINDSIAHKRVSVITGPSGVSKSTACIEACTTEIVGCVHIPCNMTCTSVSAFSSLWCERLGLPTCRTNHHRFSRIVEKLKGTSRCQLIDDAHKILASRSRTIRTTAPHCKPLEFIFDVYTATECPMVLFGTMEIDQAIADEAAWAGQLSSRVKTRYSISERAKDLPGGGGKQLFTTEDILAFAKTLGPTYRLSPPAANFLTKAANLLGFGGLRRVSNLLLTSHSVMQDRRRREYEGRAGDIIIEDVKSALVSSFGRQHAEHLFESVEQMRKQEVA